MTRLHRTDHLYSCIRWPPLIWFNILSVDEVQYVRDLAVVSSRSITRVMDLLSLSVLYFCLKRVKWGGITSFKLCQLCSAVKTKELLKDNWKASEQVIKWNNRRSLCRYKRLFSVKVKHRYCLKLFRINFAVRKYRWFRIWLLSSRNRYNNWVE